MSCEWIDVKERMPEHGQDIIVFSRMAENLAFRTVMQYLGSLNQGITHWMPLPEPPK